MSLQTKKAQIEKLFKVIIVGDPTVGKTSFVQRYVNNVFKNNYKGTVGVDFALKVIKYSDTETIKLQLWDIAGQERFTWMTRVYYKDAHGCVVMFDLTNRKTFDNALKWKKDVDAKCELADGCPLPCLLLANKCDLTDKQITHEEVEALYQESGFLSWTEVSAKDGSMVDESMKYLVEKMQAESDLLGGHPTDSSRLTLGEESNVTRKCCG